MRDLRPRVYVGAVHQDGRYPVQFVFPIDGSRTNKLLTNEQLTYMRESDNYVVIPHYQGRWS